MKTNGTWWITLDTPDKFSRNVPSKHLLPSYVQTIDPIRAKLDNAYSFHSKITIGKISSIIRFQNGMTGIWAEGENVFSCISFTELNQCWPGSETRRSIFFLIAAIGRNNVWHSLILGVLWRTLWTNTISKLVKQMTQLKALMIDGKNEVYDVR